MSGMTNWGSGSNGSADHGSVSAGRPSGGGISGSGGTSGGTGAGVDASCSPARRLDEGIQPRHSPLGQCLHLCLQLGRSDKADQIVIGRH